jgi:Ca2+-binding EF-hand superfamily protein
MESIEGKILSEGKINKKEIDEIKRMFQVIDSDASGELSLEEMANLMQRICKGGFVYSLLT